MKNIIIFSLLLAPLAVLSQEASSQHHKSQDKSIGIGIRGGLNFANVTNASSINGKSQTGFHVGVFLSPSSKSVIGSRTELTFSRQGYNYSTSTNTGSV